MFEPYDVLKATEHARHAIRRGDLATAERWMRIAERATRIVAELTNLERAAARRSESRPQRNPV